ncbi:hypothetical protein CPHO_02875 [Corynebacterium phocae]|uniref:Uncharacterized protein n=1 Tax=Corynebacterium phocae TaxID=161895 RepID=A0A1L7D1H8_9CORY|nr:hypothetical protein [Corynebacterium phocae]APT92016.1 hypothetical protein CPHO_02875 [Corynebacterium phocae]KAA8726391.1 hypothetical protein F4V58_02415 [Corynebacterium phocae]
MTGAITGAGIFVALAVLLLVLAKEIAPAATLSTLVAIAFIGWLAAETLSTTLDQWQSKVHQHPSPGGLTVAGGRVVILAATYGVAGMALLPTGAAALACAAVAGVAALIEVVALKSWQPGMDTTEVRDAWSETKQMTERLAREG